MLIKNNSHENYERAEKVKLGSDKKFGITIGIILLLVGFAPLITTSSISVWALNVGFALIGIALFKPSFFSLANIFWSKFGLFLNKIVSPIILFFLFFLVFLPFGLILKIFKKDILNLKIDKEKPSYWIKSEISSTNMVDQF